MSGTRLKTKIIYCRSVDPWHNLALEEYLLQQVQPNEVILYLWQNQHTVVIGRNQNPWKECRCQELERDGGKLARRLSGGGAVYHDLGNLNFTFVVDKRLYDLEKQLSVILKGVQKLGISAAFSGRNDLVVDGRKFSGNAFYHGKTSAYHHGTILVDVDFQKLGAYLQVSRDKMASKGVDSVQARVINLRDLVPELTIPAVINCLKESFKEIYAEPYAELTVDDMMAEVKPLYDKYASWEWRYGRSPDFDVTFEHRFTWGGVEIGLKLKSAQIVAATVYSDAMNADLIESVARALQDKPFQREAIRQALAQLGMDDGEREIVEDLSQWLQSKL